jgi:hypothetical protein
MASRRKWRRYGRRALRRLIVGALILGAFIGLGLTFAADSPAMALFIVPASAVGMVLALPFVLLALAIGIMGMALPLVIVGAIVGGPFLLLYRLMGYGSRRADEDEIDFVRLPARWSRDEGSLAPDTVLRRRYVAGELTYQQFQAGMVGLLKERFARGQLAVTEYEAELEKLLKPARELDAARDPALAMATSATPASPASSARSAARTR